jgi:hypothetical protein
MNTIHAEPDQNDRMEGGTLLPPSSSDALLPSKGEPEKHLAPSSSTGTSKTDTMNKVLKKASSLTRRQNSNDVSNDRRKGNKT